MAGLWRLDPKQREGILARQRLALMQSLFSEPALKRHKNMKASHSNAFKVETALHLGVERVLDRLALLWRGTEGPIG